MPRVGSSGKLCMYDLCHISQLFVHFCGFHVIKTLGGFLAVTSLWQRRHNVTSNTYSRRRSTYLPLFLDMPPEMQRLLIKRKTGQLVWLPNWQAHVWWLYSKRCHTHIYLWNRCCLFNRRTSPRANEFAWRNNFLGIYWHNITIEVTVY